MEWDKLFADAEPQNGATAEEIDEFVRTIAAPITSDEERELLEEHRQVVGEGCFDPPFDPTRWELPSRPLPSSYLAFLRYSNGGFFRGEHRDLDPLFTTREVRDYMLGYSILHWMPMTLPIGFDGGGGFYLLDMRGNKHSEYPVIWAHSGNLGFSDAIELAPSFQQFIECGLGPSAL